MNQFDKDLKITIDNRSKLFKNKNLLYWYKKSYEVIFNNIENIDNLSILEIGSGTSPIKHFYPNIKTSDILPLDHCDYKFDALKIDDLNELDGKTFDIITFSNVLHHIEKPLDFLLKCEKRLNENGRLIFLEPYLSFFSRFIYKYIHHELTDESIIKPEINCIQGPLSSSNSALPYLIFVKNNQWCSLVKEKFDIKQIFYFTSLSYFFTGGISHKFPIPHFIYRGIFIIDSFLTRLFPKLLSSFFILQLEKRNNTTNVKNL